MLLIFLTTIVGFGTFFLLRIIVILRCSIIVSLMFMYIIFAMNGMNKINNSPPSISDFRSFTAPKRAIINNGIVMEIDIALIQNLILCSSAFNFFIGLFPFFFWTDSVHFDEQPQTVMVTLIRHASRRLQNEFVPIALTCKWWTVRESNPVPSNYEFDALTS